MLSYHVSKSLIPSNTNIRHIINHTIRDIDGDTSYITDITLGDNAMKDVLQIVNSVVEKQDSAKVKVYTRIITRICELVKATRLKCKSADADKCGLLIKRLTLIHNAFIAKIAESIAMKSYTHIQSKADIRPARLCCDRHAANDKDMKSSVVSHQSTISNIESNTSYTNKIIKHRVSTIENKRFTSVKVARPCSHHKSSEKKSKPVLLPDNIGKSIVLAESAVKDAFLVNDDVNDYAVDDVCHEEDLDDVKSDIESVEESNHREDVDDEMGVESFDENISEAIPDQINGSSAKFELKKEDEYYANMRISEEVHDIIQINPGPKENLIMSQQKSNQSEIRVYLPTSLKFTHSNKHKHTLDSKHRHYEPESPQSKVDIQYIEYIGITPAMQMMPASVISYRSVSVHMPNPSPNPDVDINSKCTTAHNEPLDMLSSFTSQSLQMSLSISTPMLDIRRSAVNQWLSDIEMHVPYNMPIDAIHCTATIDQHTHAQACISVTSHHTLIDNGTSIINHRSRVVHDTDDAGVGVIDQMEMYSSIEEDIDDVNADVDVQFEVNVECGGEQVVIVKSQVKKPEFGIESTVDMRNLVIDDIEDTVDMRYLVNKKPKKVINLKKKPTLKNNFMIPAQKINLSRDKILTSKSKEFVDRPISLAPPEQKYSQEKKTQISIHLTTTPKLQNNPQLEALRMKAYTHLCTLFTDEPLPTPGQKDSISTPGPHSSAHTSYTATLQAIRHDDRLQASLYRLCGMLVGSRNHVSIGMTIAVDYGDLCLLVYVMPYARDRVECIDTNAFKRVVKMLLSEVKEKKSFKLMLANFIEAGMNMNK